MIQSMDVLTGMRTYVSVVKWGSFTQGAEHLGISKALASKYVQQLETHLGVRLLQRTTRRLSVTEIGHSYFEQAQRILEDLDNLQSTLFDHNQEPKGHLKITAPTTFGELYIVPLMAAYLQAYPQMNVQLNLSDRFVNVVEEGFDLAIRIGQLKDSSLIAKGLTHTRVGLYASRQYLKTHGYPSTPEDLKHHHCLLDSNVSTLDKWRFEDPQKGITHTVKIDGRFQVNSASAMKAMILAHQGIGLCPEYVIGHQRDPDIEQVLSDYPMQSLGLYMLYPQQKYLSIKTRTLMDFLEKKLRGTPPWQS